MVASTTKEVKGSDAAGGKDPKWKPRLDEEQRLLGPYPRCLDFRQYEFKSWKVFMHDGKVFKAAEEAGRPVQPNLSVSNDATLEVLYLTSDETGLDYAVIEDLPNLRELHVCPRHISSRWPRDLLWLICRNLPKLERITVHSDLVWLDIFEMESLRVVDVSRSRRLDHLMIKGCPKLARVNVRNCVKLREIAGLSADEAERLAIATQIQRMQQRSKRDGRLYRNMTYTDIDRVLGAINEGVKAAYRAGAYAIEWDAEGHCYGKEHDPTFTPYSYGILRPLEYVYTGGTGDRYAYETLVHAYDWEKREPWYSLSIGCSSPESCLDYMLDRESNMDLRIPDVRKPSNRAILAFLGRMAEEVPADAVAVRSIYLDSSVDRGGFRANYTERLDAIGFRIADEMSEDVDMIVAADSLDSKTQERFRGMRASIWDERLLVNLLVELEAFAQLKSHPDGGR